MKPYYQDSACTIYHGDCQEILPSLTKCDLVLADPPYGCKGTLNSKTRKRGPCAMNHSRRKNDYLGFQDTIEYVKEVIVPAFTVALEISKRGILTPGNRCLTFYPRPDSFGCFYQPASVGLQPWGRADAQPIFYYGAFPGQSQWIPANPCSYVLTETAEPNGHPCPKPFSIWSKLLRVGTYQSDTVLDPFMGSGTTLRAAKDLGRKAIGIEIEERYCEIAAKRLAQEVLPL